MNKLIFILVVPLVVSGCSVFRSTTADSQSNVNRQQQNDIVRDVIERIDIEIPPAVFARMVGLPLPGPDSAAVSDSTGVPEPPSEPIRITVNREERTQDNTTITTDSARITHYENTRETESKGLFGLSMGVVFGVGALLALGLIVIIHIKKFM